MGEYRQSFRGPAGERRLEIVSGRGFTSATADHHVYSTTSRPRSPDHVPSHVTTRSSQVEPKPWGFGDAEMKRRKRIAKYKVYSLEGRVKASIKNGLRWFKNKCSEIIQGY